jgi:hypothetical protein
VPGGTEERTNHLIKLLAAATQIARGSNPKAPGHSAPESSLSLANQV